MGEEEWTDFSFRSRLMVERWGSERGFKVDSRDSGLGVLVAIVMRGGILGGAPLEGN